MIDNWRNPGLTRAKIFQKFIMGLFVGLLYWQTPLTRVGISNLNGAMAYIVAELTYSVSPLFFSVNFIIYSLDFIWCSYILTSRLPFIGS
jgi:hypothetical protein